MAKILGINRNLAYELARSGTLPSIRLGKRLVCPKKAIDRLLGKTASSLGHHPGQAIHSQHWHDLHLLQSFHTHAHIYKEKRSWNHRHTMWKKY